MTPAPAAAVCDNCGKAARYGFEPECRACYWPHAMYAPNVRMAQGLEDALHVRFEAVQQQAQRESWEPLFEAFVEVGAKTEAVVAAPVSFAYDLFANARTLHIPYVSQVRAGMRAPATDENDARRRIVDILIYSPYGEEMNFAALSADGRGVPSWGPIYLQFDMQAIAYRSTVIEDNSFVFVSKRDLRLETLSKRLDLIAGYISVWTSRLKLVASKLGPRFAASTPPAVVEEVLIDPGTGRTDADYLEVHIFGPYNHQAIVNGRAAGGPLKQPINAALFLAFQDMYSQVMGRTAEIV